MAGEPPVAPRTPSPDAAQEPSTAAVANSEPGPAELAAGAVPDPAELPDPAPAVAEGSECDADPAAPAPPEAAASAPAADLGAVDGAPVAAEPPEQAAVSADSGVLEELTLPALVQAPAALPPEATIGPDGRLRIVEHLGARGRVNRYAATWQDEAGETVQVELREGPMDHVGLQREAEVLGDVQYAMLPRLYTAFEHAGRRYLAIDRLDGETLDRALRAGLQTDQALSIVLQLVQVVRRLHRSGWALIGLAPADVCLSQPIRLSQFGQAVRIGEAPSQALHVAGYSAPELAHRAVVTGIEDVYTLGAILYHALAGQPVPESGAELAALPSTVSTPGGPQLLSGALAPADERLDIEALYQGLLTLKQRLATAPIALEVASATTVGLNPTRPVNEDSCGYVTWSVAVAERIIYRALLCVADGMGGMDAGEVASRTALNSVLTAAASPLPLPPPEGSGDQTTEGPQPLDPVRLIRHAAPAVHAAARGRQMGTTITCVAVDNGQLTLGHVGDTRAYLVRGGALTQLTADHSLVAAMVASGVLPREEARGHPDSNKVLRSLGGQRELPDGYVDGLQASFDQPSLQLEPGDWIVLCTDGVWGSVDDPAIRAIVNAAADCPTVARELIERALEAGAPDNAATVVARCVRMPAA